MLSELKERLYILWGDLEEQKSALMKKKGLRSPLPPSSFDEPPSSAINITAQPNVDSDEESEVTLNAPVVNSSKAPSQQRTSTAAGAIESTSENVDPYHPFARNKAFTCCIKQYGVKVDENDPSKANAGNDKDGKGKRWERRFGLFGVNIM